MKCIRSLFAGAVFLAAGFLSGRPLAAEEEQKEAVPTIQERLDAVEEKQKVLERRYEVDQENAAAKAKEAATPLAAAKEGFALKSADGGYSLKVGGYVQADSRFYLADKAETLTDGFVTRRARITLEGTAAKYYEFKLVPDFGGGAVSLPDAYVDAHFWDGVRLRAGKFKHPFGLEQIQSDTQNLFVERSLATALVPNRDAGVQLWGELGNGAFAWAAAIFNGVPDGSNADADTADNKDFTGRLFLQPFKNGSSLAWKDFGFGAAVTDGKQKGTGVNTAAAVTLLPSYRTEGQNSFFTYRSLDTVADGRLTRFSPQLYWYPGRTGLLAEYVSSREQVKRATTTVTTATLENRAWQVEASYVLTGENASFKGVKPLKPFDPKNGGWGAWEVAGRYSQIVIDKDAFPRYADPAKSARVARAWTGGLNWYVSQAVKVASNFTYTWFDRGGAPDRPTERAIVSRVQLVF